MISRCQVAGGAIALSVLNIRLEAAPIGVPSGTKLSVKCWPSAQVTPELEGVQRSSRRKSESGRDFRMGIAPRQQPAIGALCMGVHLDCDNRGKSKYRNQADRPPKSEPAGGLALAVAPEFFPQVS